MLDFGEKKKILLMYCFWVQYIIYKLHTQYTNHTSTIFGMCFFLAVLKATFNFRNSNAQTTLCTAEDK